MYQHSNLPLVQFTKADDGQPVAIPVSSITMIETSTYKDTIETTIYYRRVDGEPIFKRIKESLPDAVGLIHDTAADWERSMPNATTQH